MLVLLFVTQSITEYYRENPVDFSQPLLTLW